MAVRDWRSDGDNTESLAVGDGSMQVAMAGISEARGLKGLELGQHQLYQGLESTWTETQSRIKIVKGATRAKGV